MFAVLVPVNGQAMTACCSDRFIAKLAVVCSLSSTLMNSTEAASPAEPSSSQFLCDLSRLSGADSNLHNGFESEWSGLSDNCILCSDEQYPCTLEPQTLKISGIIHNSWKTTIYTADCHDGTELVLKFTNKRERIVLEYGVYHEQLASLQGTAVPKFYGMLSIQGTTQENDYGSCLVIERFGTRIDEGTLRYMTVLAKYVLR